MPQNGEINTKFGVYTNQCCGREIVLAKGLEFPSCPHHPKWTTKWELIGAESMSAAQPESEKQVCRLTFRRGLWSLHVKKRQARLLLTEPSKFCPHKTGDFKLFCVFSRKDCVFFNRGKSQSMVVPAVPACCEGHLRLK